MWIIIKDPSYITHITLNISAREIKVKSLQIWTAEGTCVLALYFEADNVGRDKEWVAVFHMTRYVTETPIKVLLR